MYIISWVVSIHEQSKSYKHCMVIINANGHDSYCFEIAR